MRAFAVALMLGVTTYGCDTETPGDEGVSAPAGLGLDATARGDGMGSAPDNNPGGDLGPDPRSTDTGSRGPPPPGDIGAGRGGDIKDAGQVGLDTFDPPDTGPGPSLSEGYPVAAGCLDGDYTEVLPTPSVDISAHVDGYKESLVQGFVLGVLGLRFPTGGYLVEQALESPNFGNCITAFLWDPATADGVIGSLSTVVHECGHFADMDLSFAGWNNSYIITESLTYACEGGGLSSLGGQTFARSLLMSDSFSELRPPCPEGTWGDGVCDTYANTYLTGNSGNQGFDMLLEEAVQYVNSLATGYAFHDYYTWGVSERDGIATFLWYLERYLYLARTEHPGAYEALLEDGCWRGAILTVWGRAWLYLSLTEEMNQLGLYDDGILSLVMDPSLLAEIESVRDAHGCD